MSTTGVLLASVDEAFDHPSWHGTNLRGSLRGMTPAKAAWRINANRHNIWELVVHAAYWKYDIRRRLTSETCQSFLLEGSNFWTRPLEGSLAEWRRDLALLHSEHNLLRAVVAAFPENRWDRKAPGKPFTFGGLVRGIAAHDLYHAGQIQLLKRLQQS